MQLFWIFMMFEILRNFSFFDILNGLFFDVTFDFLMIFEVKLEHEQFWGNFLEIWIKTVAISYIPTSFQIHLVTQISTMYHCNISCNFRNYYQKYDQFLPIDSDYRFSKLWNFSNLSGNFDTKLSQFPLTFSHCLQFWERK